MDGYQNPADNNENCAKPQFPLMSIGSLPCFTQDPMEIQSGSEFSEIPTPETESVNDSPISMTRLKENPKNLKLLKKSVSIVPPTPRKVMEKSQCLSPEDASSNYDSFANNERTPLLVPCSSLPTVIGYDETPVSEYPEPSHYFTTRSEVGRDELHMKRNKSRRRRCNTGKTAELQKTRPFIASPFMPITTQLSITADRRSLPGSVSRNPNRRLSGYGSTRLFEEGRLNKEDNNTDEEEEEEDESSCENESSISEVSVSPKASFAALSSREWATIIMLALANLCSTVAFSCIAPFYPKEASMKGMTESQTGMVFGVFELVMFIAAPLFGKYMTVIGSKKMFSMGLAITGVTAIMFGFLNFLPSGTMFFWASLLIRMLEAVGDAAFLTSSFAISAKCFPGKIAVIIGLMETFSGLGYTAGPLIGGFLYEFGGFQTPFLVLGIILILATFLSCWLIESHDGDEQVSDSKGMVAMLRIPVIWIMVYAIIVCAITLSFLDPTLSVHLQSFNLSPTMIGLMFLLCGGIYTISAPFWGVLIDKYHCSTSVMLFGSICTAISMVLIGPSVFMPLEKSLVLIGISLAVLGVAAGALYIPTFQSCLDAVKAHGYDDSFSTYGCVSGVFQSAFALGAFIGPTLGGFAVEKIGFEWTTTIIGAIHVVFILSVCIFYGTTCCIKKSSSIRRA